VTEASPPPPSAPKPAEPAPSKPKKKTEEPPPERVVIRARPKVIFLYPLFVAAVIAGAWTHAGLAGGGTLDAVSLTPGRLFTWVFIFNLLALSFDFTRGEFIALLLFFGVAVLSILLLDQNYDIGLLVKAKALFGYFKLRAHPHVYYMFAVSLGLVFIGVWIQGWFDYWEISHNEIKHHKGFLGDLKRYPAPNLRLTKEITDLFEHCLFLPVGGAGRIVLTPQGSNRSVVLDNVVGVNKIENRIQHMLSSLQVKVDTGHHGPAEE
tara:strand:+ start:767 stop:1561 length:795 start_codon:yes stop_codon:yes gene_type:complete